MKTGRIQIIEQKLDTIDSAAFQNLCDMYLNLREGAFTSFNRTGSQIGKQKTVKGTPDTFFRLANGNLQYVEFTTKAKKGIVKKIKEDIDKCINPKLTGIPVSSVNKILLCFNSKVDTKQETEIIAHAQINNIQIELIGIDILALDIYLKYPILQKDPLGLPIDTAQILPLDTFIGEYDNKGGQLSTPLSNVFLHRKTELITIAENLAEKDLLIITGLAGVGKTRIALEAVKEFIISNPSYSGYVIAEKSKDIYADLRIYLLSDKDYILMVDDANRQLINLNQILGIFKEKRKGNIKLVLTVRDYALKDIENECLTYNFNKIILEKFTDAEITALISCDAFNIVNPQFQKKIIELADGNARLAIMSAKLALEQQGYFLYPQQDDKHIFELYDAYFRTFIKDFDTLNTKDSLKVLGIISFFYTIDKNNKEFIKNLLETFEIDYYTFYEIIDRLEARELLEVRNSYIKVSEQIMATYFFYKVFIKDKILSFRSLLFKFFPDYKKRFEDTLTPASNTFNYLNVQTAISSTLDDYLKSIYSDEDKAFDFFSLFAPYKRSEMVNYVYQSITKYPESNNPIYNTHYETNASVFKKDNTLGLLARLLHCFSEDFNNIVELSFEYCRKIPKSLPEFINLIKERLLINEYDQTNNFTRQTEFFDIIFHEFREQQPHYIQAFFPLAKLFLLHTYNSNESGRNGTIRIVYYTFPMSETPKRLRINIWKFLFEYFEKYPTDIFEVIKDYRIKTDFVSEILESDLSLLLPFIENNFSKDNFEHVYFVNEFVKRLDKQKLASKGYRNLKKKFESKDDKYFKLLDWTAHKNKQNYDFDNIEDFYDIKRKEGKKNLIFHKKEDFAKLHKAIKNVLLTTNNDAWDLGLALNCIVKENFLINNELGFSLLESILDDYKLNLYVFYETTDTISNYSEDWALKLWNKLSTWQNPHSLNAQILFFYSLAQVTEFYKMELLKTISSINSNCYLRLSNFEKFIILDKNIISDILQIVVNKIEKESLHIKLDDYIFEKYTEVCPKNAKLVEKAYLQQEKNNNTFDNQQNGLKFLIQENKFFLMDFLREFYANEDNPYNLNTDKHKKLGFIWDFGDAETVIEDSFQFIIDNSHYLGIGEPILVIFFNNLNEQQALKAEKFILKYVEQNTKDKDKINLVINIVLHKMPMLFEDVLLSYITLNTDVEDFKKIHWKGNGVKSYVGEVYFGEIWAKKWQNILEIVEKSKKQLDLIPIKTYIKAVISGELQYAERERDEKFRRSNGW